MSERREQIYQHLREHPDLTAYELSRALGLASAGGTFSTLKAMLGDGEVSWHEGPRGQGDRRPSIKWRAT